MAETRKIAAILVADIVGYSRLASAEEVRTLSRLRALHGDLIDPAVAAHRGRIVKRTGDGYLVEFRSVVDAVSCAIEMQSGLTERNAGVNSGRRIEFRVAIHLGDVVEETDGDLMGDGVNIAAHMESIAKPGGIYLSEDAYRQVRGRLDFTVADLGPTRLKNIAEPIRIYSVELGRSVKPKHVPAPAPGESVPPRLSMVVLPFSNIGRNPDQEHFVDGLTESLTTDLSRISDALVIARNTAFTYKDKALDVKKIGRELNVRYVLEGSVQRSGKRNRVSVQLIDAETGNHLWAERFDKLRADLFDMQDEIVTRLANELNAQLVAAEARRAEQATLPDSMDLYFRGLAWLNRGSIPDNVAQARSLFDQALTVDPENVEALVGSARADVTAAGYVFVNDPTAVFATAEAKLTKALSAVPDHARAHLYLGFVEIFTKRAAQGIAECEHALLLDRNLAQAHAFIGLGKIYVGCAEETESNILAALHLSPRDTFAYIWMSYAGVAKNHLGIWDQAIAWLRRSIEANRNHPYAHFRLAAALAQLGLMDEADAAVKAGLALTPTFSISRARAPWTARSDDKTYLAQLERILDGLRKAGVPEE